LQAPLLPSMVEESCLSRICSEAPSCPLYMRLFPRRLSGSPPRHCSEACISIGPDTTFPLSAILKDGLLAQGSFGPLCGGREFRIVSPLDDGVTFHFFPPGDQHVFQKPLPPKCDLPSERGNKYMPPPLLPHRKFIAAVFLDPTTFFPPSDPLPGACFLKDCRTEMYCP